MGGCSAKRAMASVSSQPQFRHAQPPSKVLHLRNLPWDCAEDELVELGKPFGKVINTKCNVGAYKNQAFIELADLNQAIAMISYYASSSEPAQVRGKTVFLQYSNRQEIVNNKTTADLAGNVLLVTIEGTDARLVSIDVLHLVFSAFGFVHKITTFEKTAGFQALVLFADAETASSAKDALDGRCIPRGTMTGVETTLYLTYLRQTQNSESSILGQPPSAMISARAQQYARVQYMPSPSQPMVHQTMAGWGSAPVPQSTKMQAPNAILPYGQTGAAPQSMPMQVPNSIPPKDMMLNLTSSLT